MQPHLIRVDNAYADREDESMATWPQGWLEELDDYKLKVIYEYLYPFAKVSGFRPWAEEVRSLDVVLHRAGRAVIREPSADWSVELRFEAPQVSDASAEFYILACQVTPDADGRGWLPLADVSIGKYVCALYLELMRQERGGHRSKKRIELPAPGKPPSVAHYKALLDELQQLKREGHPSPAKELARRYGTPVGTMKSWLHRARDYVGGET
jgi:hypothetical protein